MSFSLLNIDDGCEVKFLSQTGIERADAILAVTADDEDNLIALRIFKADPSYINAITALGYPLPDADKLIALRVQKADPFSRAGRNW